MRSLDDEKRKRLDREHRRAASRAWLVASIVPIGLLLLLGIRNESRLSALMVRAKSAVDSAVTPASEPQGDIIRVVIVGNSLSDEVWNVKKQGAAEELAISRALGGKPVYTLMLRFASTTVEVFNGPANEIVMHAALKDYWINVKPDPVSGSFLASALRRALEFGKQYPDAILLVTIVTDGFEDVEEVRAAATQLSARKRTIVIAHGVPVHNPKAAMKQLRKIENIQAGLAVLGPNHRAVPKLQFPDTVDRWLPAKLAENSYVR